MAGGEPERQRENLARWRTIPENQQLARERSRAWRIANPQRRSEQAGRRNALKRSGQAIRIPMELLEAKLAYWGWRCWIAGPNCTGDPEQWDHVKPLSKGGAHLLANLRPACQPCNFGKRAQWPFPTAWPATATAAPTPAVPGASRRGGGGLVEAAGRDGGCSS
jgi:5-methylcytosine-specific restriction endonuclease McrA